MRDEPHGTAGLAPLPLKELPQQPLHLAVAGIRALHGLLGVQTVSRAEGTKRHIQSRTAAADAIGQSQPLDHIFWGGAVEISIVRHNHGLSLSLHNGHSPSPL